MKPHTTNYFGTFIQVSEDCPAQAGTPPPDGEPKSAARLIYEMLREKPYHHTSDDLLYEAAGKPKGISREVFFSKGQACLRASALGKRYGWGVHFDPEGKAALYGMETPEYQRLRDDKTLTQLRAMRSARKK